MVPFGGWEMPLAYPSGRWPSTGPAATSAVVFDVSHLGTVRVTGPDAFDHLQYSLSNDLRKISPGRAQYTHLLDETGSVTDDIIVWWVDEERFDVMPNASNTSRVVAAIGGEDVTDERAIIAVQGPEARALLADGLAGGGRRAPIRRGPLHLGGRPLPGGRYRLHRRGRGRVCRAGRSGRGASGRPWWRPGSRRPDWARATRCASRRACRCTATSSDRASRRSRPNWAGSSAGPRATSSGAPPLEEEKAEGPARRLRGVVGEGRQPLRDGAEVQAGGRCVGRLTSGNFSPMRERGIGLALIDADAQLLDGDAVTVVQRGRSLAATLVRPPLWPPRVEE